MKKVFSVLCTLLLLAGAKAQTKAVSHARALESIILSALNYFNDNRLSQLKTYQQEDSWAGSKKNFTYTDYKTSLKWPGASDNYIQCKQMEEYQSGGDFYFIAHLPAATTEAAAMQTMQKHWNALNGLVVQVIPGQKDTLKGTLNALNGGSNKYSSLLSRTYSYKGEPREIWVAMHITQNNGVYQPSVEVRASVNSKDIVYRNRPELVNQLVKAAFANFSDAYTTLHDSKEQSLGGGTIYTKEYLARSLWPGYYYQRVIHTKGVKNNGTVTIDSWRYLTWITTSTNYDRALQAYKHLYQQINGCTVVSPSGKTYVLNAAFQEPGTTLAGTKRGLIDFNQMFTAEKVDISIELIFDNNMYYVQLTVSHSNS